MKFFKKTWSILNNKDKKKFLIIIFFFILLSFLEVLSIATIIPFVAAIFNPESLESIKFISEYISVLQQNKDIIIPIFCAIFFSVFLLKNIFSLYTYRFIYKFIYNFKAYISQKILKKFFQQDYLFFVKNTQGRLASTMSSEASNFSDVYLNSVMILLSETIILLGIIVLILLSGKSQGLLVIMPIILFAGIIIKILNKKVKNWGKQRVTIASNTSDLVQRIFLGIRDVYFSNTGNHIIENFYSLSKKQSKIDINNQTFQMFPKVLLEISGLAILLILILYFVKLEVSEKVILSNLTFYFVVAYRAIPSFNKILVQYQRIKYSKNSVDIIHNILKLEDARILSLAETNETKFSSSIKIEDYDFSYPGNKIFNNLNLQINKGECIGIYGESGSGKSTLLNLLTLLLKPDKGFFYIDDKLIDSKEEIKKFQNMVTFVSQDTFLIDDTIKNNIVFNEQDKIDDIKLNYAIEFAKVNKFCEQFEGGISYKVGSHSRRISSGQRQRISIARAIYNLKEFLILDEATNALDEKTEKEVFNNIFKLKGKKTIIIVSHNKNNLLNCDSVYSFTDKNIKLIDINKI